MPHLWALLVVLPCMGMQISSYPSIDELYEEIGSLQPKTIVVPGLETRRSLLRRFPAFLGPDRVLTLPQFWAALASRSQEDFPEELRASEMRLLLTTLLESEEELASLLRSSSGAEVLRTSLQRHVVWQRPFVGMQDSLQRATDQLRKKGALPAQRRSLLADSASGVSWGGRIVFLHPPEITPLLARLFYNLAEKNDVSVLLLGEGMGPVLEEVGLPEEGLGPVLKPAVRGTWQRSEDVLSAAAEAATSFIKDGVPAEEIAVVFAAEEPEDFVRRAEEYQLPVLWRRSYRARETELGYLLLHPERVRCGAFELQEGEGERLGDDISGYITLAEELLLRSSADASEEALMQGAALLRALHSLRDVLQSQDIPLHPRKAIEDLSTERISLGNSGGVRLLSLGEVVGTSFSRTIFLGLGASQYPPQAEEDPLLGPLPGYHPQATWQAALASAGEALFLRPDLPDDPGSFLWQKHAEGETVFPLRGSRRKQARRMAERGVGVASPERLYRQETEGQRQVGGAYSVTELEQYLLCPYGWFVRYKLRPKSLETEAQKLGNVAHDLLEELWTFPDEERYSKLQELFPERAAALPLWQRDPLLGRLERLLERFSGPSWPFAESVAERPLSLNISNEEGIEWTIRGRADRLDFRSTDSNKEVLVIDYKSRRPGRSTSARLQPFLYPLMAASETGADPLGFLYLSIAHGDAEGHLRSPVPELPHLPLDWNYKKELALSRTKEAIDGIEAGRWNERGKRCPAYCPHRLLEARG